MKTNGVHLLVEYINADLDKLADKDFIENSMLETARHVNATIVTHFFHKFTPTGVSGAIIIAESHLSIHTWPEDGYAAVDFYTCGNLDASAAVPFLAHLIQAKDYKVTSVIRGHPKDL